MKNIKTRLLSLLLTIVMLAGALAAVPLNAQDAPETQTRTVMLYLVGSNLEFADDATLTRALEGRTEI